MLLLILIGVVVVGLLLGLLVQAVMQRTPHGWLNTNNHPPWVGDIESVTLENEAYRKVLFTGKHSQLVVMKLQPGQEIGREVHADVDQFIRIEKGEGLFEYRVNPKENWTTVPIRENFAMFIPAGVAHNVRSAIGSPVHLYTLYAPPEHPPLTLQTTKP